MLIKHNRKSPQIHETAYVAPTATVCGDVTIGANCRILHGASIVAEGGHIEIGTHGIIMENVVIRSNEQHPAKIGNHCLIGPNAHVVGCTIEDEVFIATGSAIFHGAHLGRGSEVRVNGIVHLRSKLPAGEFIPIGWIGIGDPIRILPPNEHDKIWEVQEPLNFPLFVYGYDRPDASMVKITKRLSEKLTAHFQDEVLP